MQLILLSKKYLYLFFLIAWGGLLWSFLTYDGFSGNDFSVHVSYVNDFLSKLSQGQINVDSWIKDNGFGAPVYRVYQHWPHLMAAFLSKATGANAAFSVHFITGFCWLLQFPVFFFVASWLGFSWGESAAVSLMAPLIQGYIGTGHELRSYLLYGFGLYTQAVAFPLFVCVWAMILRWTGLAIEEETFSKKKGWWLGFAMGVLFLLHHFYGYIAGFIFVICLLAALKRKTLRFDGELFGGLVLFAVSFSVLTAYQFLSIFQDLPLIHRSIYFESLRSLGWGLPLILKLFFTGAFFDSARLPFYSAFTVIGTYCLWKSEKRKFCQVLLVHLAGVLCLMAGRKTWGTVLDLIPGLGRLDSERFIFLAHLCGIFLAGYGVCSCWRYLHKIKQQVWMHSLLAAVLFTSVAYLVKDRVLYILVNHTAIRMQNENRGRFLEPFLPALYAQRGVSNFWTPYLENYAEKGYHNPRFANVRYSLAVEELGISSMTNPPNEVNYGAEAVSFFDVRNPVHYGILNIQQVLLDKHSPIPPFLTEIVRTEENILLKKATGGNWDVVEIPAVKITPDVETWYQEVAQWFRSDMASRGQYPSFVPQSTVQSFPQGVPKMDARSSSTNLGHVVSQTPLLHGKSSAVLEATDANQYGLLRTAYHPNWKILRNGKEVPPLWVGPGFLSFSLLPGRNTIEATFKQDPLRHFLLKGSVLFFGVMLCWWVGIFLCRIRIPFRFSGRRFFLWKRSQV